MTEQRPEPSLPAAPLLILFGAVVLLLLALLPPRLPTRETRVAAATATAQAAPPQIVGEPTAPPPTPAASAALDPQMVAAGDQIYHSICMACHGFNARGIAGLGKTLIGSDYVNSLTDEELLAFLQVGRAVTDPLNTTGVAMPARGGNPNLTDDDLRSVIAYIRSLNPPQMAGGQAVAAAPTVTPIPSATPSGPLPTPTEFKPPSLGEAAVALLPTPRGDRLAGPDPFFTNAEVAYRRACSGCHGDDGQPVPFLATQPISASPLVQARDGFGLFSFLTRAQPPVSPLEGYNHPYRGGYPPLTDEQIRSIIVYLYSLQ